jgi:hypothetical protein
VSSQIGSISQSGENLPTPPRANWFFDQNYTQVELIAATIRQHIAPEPSIAYRTEILKLINSPWHSTAFPDTEILLEALTFGDVAFGEKETVLYRESPESASHHLNLKNRDQGAALGLARFFGGKNFESFCKDLSPRQRNQFASEVLDALEVRITEDEMLTFCKLFFIEMVCSIWGYSDSDSATLASNLNARTGNRRAAQTLKNVALFSDQASTKHERAHADIKKLGVKKRDFRRKILGGYKSFAKSTISKLNKREIIFLVKLLTRLGLLKAWKFPRKFDE